MSFAALAETLREGTRLAPTALQRNVLHQYMKREQFLEEYHSNKPLSFNARSFQKTHPGMMRPDVNGDVHVDADATLVSPMLLGVADGVSSLGNELGIDGSELPNELLQICKEMAMSQLISGRGKDSYGGPISLLKEAYESSESLGSTTILLSVLDNSSIVHGRLHPMIAVLTIGDCELLLLRRPNGPDSPLDIVFHTEMQRIEHRIEAPLQLGRVDERVDPEFDDHVGIEVIEKGSAVQCVSVFEGDIVILGSDGIFDNLFLEEVVDACNYAMPVADDSTFVPVQPVVLSQLARQLVHQSHSKTKPGAKRHLPEAPIGKGGKMDDTSVVVAEVIEYDDDMCTAWAQQRSTLDDIFLCNSGFSPFDDFEKCAVEGCKVLDDSSDDGTEMVLVEQEKVLMNL